MELMGRVDVTAEKLLTGGAGTLFSMRAGWRKDKDVTRGRK